MNTLIQTRLRLTEFELDSHIDRTTTVRIKLIFRTILGMHQYGSNTKFSSSWGVLIQGADNSTQSARSLKLISL
jgi:hypothetical protein